MIVSKVPLGPIQFRFSGHGSIHVCPDVEEKSDADKAILCQHAEHKFAGVKCCIMDQVIAVMGKAGQGLASCWTVYVGLYKCLYINQFTDLSV